MSAIINEELRARIKEIFLQEVNVNNLFMLDQIPPDKLQNARNSYVPNIAEDEAIIFLFDDTLFGSANEGFLLTTKHLFRKNIVESMGVLVIDYIDGITAKHGFLSSTITARAGMHKLDMTVTQAEGRKQKVALFNILNNTVALLKNSRNLTTNTNQVSQPQQQSIKSRNCQSCGAPCTDNAHRCEYCDSLL